MMRMNLQRGFFRLWVASSILWIASIGVMVGPGYRDQIAASWSGRAAVSQQPPKNYFDRFDTPSGRNGGNDPLADLDAALAQSSNGYVSQPISQTLFDALKVFLGPPLVLLLFGLAALWIVRGFVAAPSPAGRMPQARADD